MITVLFFGKLAEIAGAKAELQAVASTDELLEQLRLQYPALAAEKYIVAVDKKTITGNTSLTDHCTVALLPPFSGG
ncbi:MoaD/ThiS family protein [Lacibacter luteus]|uniref:MoaD/ThiS family protein n=1 Tax=Lacibacter luteus TaxID=2508719 RepID=A0A4Q1CLX7_9BACT|nr:MoaD/ThiS family protein [Lacibacter luteus]RXK61715.1 MoaD/ThiS family protein [Lacibacter luteus]